ncbi:hypothetical protein DDZ13_05100 [Coraliomargarita sinensis]|uniref:Uncharacterized protein n=1 Tax=Coraliomargarita sinensis TaxID=2174842 RepID=A0A317ZG05_9BACT|nr:hypothetical protein [Coraliomargarita sinensis]PXA04554.1 hypothetical protein DDZ13_05100 [Coraliomargarita sinensis]
MKKKRIDLTIISDSGKWLIESNALSYKSEERASLVLNRENEKASWLILSVGDSDPEQEFPKDGTQYKDINPFTAEEFDVPGIEGVIRYYTFKATKENEGREEKSICARLLSILNPPVFVGMIAIEGLRKVPEELQSELRKRLKDLNFFEKVDLVETPT